MKTIKKSCNRNKTVWDIVKLEINKSGYTDRINTLNVRGTSITNSQEIVNVFNKYFLSIAKNINSTNSKQSNYNLDDTTPIDYLLQSFKTPFPSMKLKSLSTKDADKIIKSLKPKTLLGMMGYPQGY